MAPTFFKSNNIYFEDLMSQFCVTCSNRMKSKYERQSKCETR